MPELKCCSWTEEAYEVPIRHVGFESDGHPVPVEEFHYDGLDSMEDRAREALRAGIPLKAIIEGLVLHREHEIGAHAVRCVLGMMIRSKNWQQTAYALCFACGLADQNGWTQPDIAKKLGITKQAMNQAVKKVSQNLHLRKTRMMRDDDAKRNMSINNRRQMGL